MNRDKENLSIKYNTSVDRKLSHQIHPIANSKKSIFGKPAEVNLNEKKTGVNSRKSSNIFVGSKQNKLQENQMKRKSVSPIASSKFKTPITNNSNNANTKPHEKKTNLSEVQKEKTGHDIIDNKTYFNVNLSNSPKLKEEKVTDNSLINSNSNNSKNKRKYSIFAKESEADLKLFSDFQSNCEYCYKEYETAQYCNNWIKIFKEKVLLNHIIIDDESFMPRTLSSSASKILNSQIFWILYIEYIKITKSEISIQIMIDLFNESFKHINEENLIKSYYLNSIKQIDGIKMREYLIHKGKTLKDTSDLITNDIYLDLLLPFTQFFLRSKTKKLNDLNSSEEGRKIKKINYHPENISACQDLQLMITSKSKREFVNTQISQNLNFVFSKSKLPYCNIMLFKNFIANLDVENNNFQFKTPIQKDNLTNFKIPSESKITKSVKEVDENKSPITSMVNSVSNRDNSELKDLVHDPKYLLTQKTENMIVSQNTVNKQIEFLYNLGHANSTLINLSQSNFDHDNSNNINYSMYPNVTQESEYNDHNTNPFCENQESISNSFQQDENNETHSEGNLKEKKTLDEINDNPDIKEEINEEDKISIKEDTYITNKSQDNNIGKEREELFEADNVNVIDSPFDSFKTKSNQEGVEKAVSSYNTALDNIDDNFQLNCSKFKHEENEPTEKDKICIVMTEEASQKKNSEEDLDNIYELESHNECEGYNSNNMNNCYSSSNVNVQSFTRDPHNLNLSVHSNHSRSRSHRRSKYQSMISEEFPSDLVEGSIRTFNQSFSGMESINKSERLTSGTKRKEDF